MCGMSSYTLASPIADLHDSGRPTVLLLRGWVPGTLVDRLRLPHAVAVDLFHVSNFSFLLLAVCTSGPTYYLKSKLQTEFDCDFVEPTLLMPPFFNLSCASLWCYDFNFLWMLLVVLAFLWGLLNVWWSYEGRERFLFLSCLILALAFWIRLMVAVVARSAIADGVEKCLTEIRQKNVVLCVGFSWGAGVLSELLTKDIGLDTRPAFVLMAPVSAATAMAAMREDAAFRLHPLDLSDSIHVVHASDDPYFCPHQERWNNIPGVETTTLQDNHTFKSASSRRALGEIVSGLYRMKVDGVEDL